MSYKDPRILKRPRLADYGKLPSSAIRSHVPARQQSQTGSSGQQSNFSNDGFKVPLSKEPQLKRDEVHFTLYLSSQESKPKQVILDDQGRLVDEKGNVLNVKKATELKINQKSQKDNKVNDLLKMKKHGQATTGELLSKRKFYDSSLESGSKRDKKKQSAFNFIQEGQFIKRGELLRKKQVMEQLENEDAKKEEDENVQVEQTEQTEEAKKINDERIKIRKTVNLKPLDPIPDIEWWDQAVIRDETKEKVQIGQVDDNDIFQEKVTHYVQHPLPIKNDYVENINKMIVPVHLTQKEKKRLRKMKRVEKEKDKQEKVKLGLMPPPLPKIKLSNYMKVLGREAIADPSKVEQQVKKIVDKRQEDHLKRNESNKLTSQQKEAKMRRKHERDIQQNECRVALFKVDKLTNPQIKFKVDINAQQYHLGGFCFIADYTMAPSDLPNMILVEGGPRAIKKYKRLLLRRIEWTSKVKKRNNEDADQDNDNNQKDNEDVDEMKESLDQKCFLVWEGTVKKRNFEKWRVVDIRSEGEAKRLLAEKGVEHYWTEIVNFNPKRAQGDEPEPLEKALM